MIRIMEVGPRDGLQNEKTIVPVEAKVAFVDTLSGTGLTEIEASAFVSPRWVPQLGDAEEVFEHRPPERVQPRPGQIENPPRHDVGRFSVHHVADVADGHVLAPIPGELGDALDEGLLVDPHLPRHHCPHAVANALIEE